MNKVLVLGGSGLVGKAIINELNKYEDYDTFATYYRGTMPLSEDRSIRIDIEDLQNVKKLMNTIKPQIVVSCLRGDFDKQLALHIETAQYLKKNGGRLYFFSTANVFDNDLSKAHYEEDLPNACSDYGQYKAACESSITEILKDNACILRLPQVWAKLSPRMNQLISSLQNNEEITVYPNLMLNTTTDIIIAKQLCHIIEQKLSGIFHLAAQDIISHKDFYKELILQLGFKNPRFKDNLEQEGHFALLSNRQKELSGLLAYSNMSVIEYLSV